jgi:hypothetical protein
MLPPIRGLGVGIDLAVAEVADEDVARETPERRRREREPPRRVELALLRDTCDEVAGEVVRVDEAATLPGDLVSCVSVLFRI